MQNFTQEVVSMHPEGPDTGRVDTRFSVFLGLQANAEMVPKLQVSTAC
jgi:hypothetical protein